MERFEIKLPAELAASLQEAADRRGISRSSMVNVVLFDFLAAAPELPAGAKLQIYSGPKPETPDAPVGASIAVIEPPGAESVPTPAADLLKVPELRAEYDYCDGSFVVRLDNSVALDLGFKSPAELADALQDGVLYDGASHSHWLNKDALLELATIFDMEDKEPLASAIRNLIEKIESETDQEHPD